VPVKYRPNRLSITAPEKMDTLVENRRIYNLKSCELNLYETSQKAFDLPLTFNEFVISSMINGKKIMRMFDDPAFEYLPGETVIVPANETMLIDFPEADLANPVQCAALKVDTGYVNDTINYLNNYYSNIDENISWKLEFNQYHFSNTNEITELINKIISICRSSDKAKNIYADLSLKELLIRLLQSQRLQQVSLDMQYNTNSSRLNFVFTHIRENLSEKIVLDALSKKAYLSRNMFFKWFKQQCGVSPLEYITAERIKLSKQLLAETNNSIQTVSAACGFTDVNYFIRVFKKVEGLTPKSYQSRLGK
jgi:AraC-like DNA-binding protein